MARKRGKKREKAGKETNQIFQKRQKNETKAEKRKFSSMNFDPIEKV